MKKFDVSNLGYIPMTDAARIWLMTLRAYLIVMVLFVFYHVFALAMH